MFIFSIAASLLLAFVSGQQNKKDNNNLLIDNSEFNLGGHFLNVEQTPLPTSSEENTGNIQVRSEGPKPCSSRREMAYGKNWVPVWKNSILKTIEPETDEPFTQEIPKATTPAQQIPYKINFLTPPPTPLNKATTSTLDLQYLITFDSNQNLFQSEILTNPPPTVQSTPQSTPQPHFQPNFQLNPESSFKSNSDFNLHPNYQFNFKSNSPPYSESNSQPNTHQNPYSYPTSYSQSNIQQYLSSPYQLSPQSGSQYQQQLNTVTQFPTLSQYEIMANPKSSLRSGSENKDEVENIDDIGPDAKALVDALAGRSMRRSYDEHYLDTKDELAKNKSNSNPITKASEGSKLDKQCVPRLKERKFTASDIPELQNTKEGEKSEGNIPTRISQFESEENLENAISKKSFEDEGTENERRSYLQPEANIFSVSKDQLMEPTQGKGISPLSSSRMMMLESSRVCYACSTIRDATCWSPNRRTTVKYCRKGHEACVTRRYRSSHDGAIIVVRDCDSSCEARLPALDTRYESCSVCKDDLCNNSPIENSAIPNATITVTFIIFVIGLIQFTL